MLIKWKGRYIHNLVCVYVYLFIPFSIPSYINELTFYETVSAAVSSCSMMNWFGME